MAFSYFLKKLLKLAQYQKYSTDSKNTLLEILWLVS